MGKLIDYVSKLFALLAGILLVLVTLFIGYVIFARIIDISSPAWIVQFTEYSLLWMTFLGTAWVLSRDRHVSIDLITSRLTPRGKIVLDIAHNLVGCGVCVVLCWFGVLTTWSMFQRGVIDVQVVDVAKYQVVLIIPLGFFLLALQFLRKMLMGFHSVRHSDSLHGNLQDESSDA
ncbi:MAG TPA: TRAP transporter small permease [Desulfomonilaceae bacterium]|nr:TRAP transporter small permease [Desulfomonilaceae bacterium]